MEFRSYILLFSLLIFVLAAVGMIIFFSAYFLSFWLMLALVIAYLCTIDVFFPLLAGNSKLSRQKLLLLTFSVTIISVAVSSTIWTIITPKWSFSVTTNSAAYSLGESVQITVTLENHGFISHSIASPTANPVVATVYALYEDPTLSTQVWYSLYVLNETTFVVSPGQALVRTFVWNQTNFVNPWFWNTTYKAGTYRVEAFIPESSYLLGSKLFSAKVYINVTATALHQKIGATNARAYVCVKT